MTDKEIDAMKLALEALELWSLMQPQTTACAIRIPAITAIKEVLKEHAMRETQRLGQEIEQEPVAWWNDTGTHIDLNVSGRGAPLYTTPPQRTWVGLTDEEIYMNCPNWLLSHEQCKTWVRQIEAKLKEKT